jgi:CheY-like chemotaxis protein
MSPPQLLDLAGVSLLVIEGNPDVRDLLLVLLARAGALASGTGSGREAIERLAAEAIQPDAILCDVHMRGGDGYVFLKRLRQQREFSRIPVIAMSGDRTGGARSALSAGFDGHVQMPFSESALRDEVRRVLKGTYR